MSDEKLCKAERLRIAGTIAPIIRTGGKRRVLVERKDGSVTPIDDAALLKALAERTEIEIAVLDGKRPEAVICAVCGQIKTVHGGPRAGGVPTYCGPKCANRANPAARRESRKKYLATAKGREQQRESERRFKKKWRANRKAEREAAKAAK